MTETPSNYDLIQDGRLDDLESLITADHQPPEGTEYSYPVASQGITQEQFRTMMRAAGKGTFVASSEEGAQVAYRLHTHATDSETNQRNTLILRPPTGSRKAESVSNGFFHVLTEDMELPFPAVTTATTYHVTVTYDPRLFKTTPLKIEVYPGTPPTSNGRDHIVLFTVQREPNQLLSQATITTKGAWISSVVTTFAFDRLPEPWDVDYGTLGVVVDHTGLVEIYTSRGIHGWIKHEYRTGEWKDLAIFSAFGWSGMAKWRKTLGGIDVIANLSNPSYPETGTQLVQFPTAMTFKREFSDVMYTASGPGGLYAEPGGRSIRTRSGSRDQRFNVFIPDYFINIP